MCSLPQFKKTSPLDSIDKYIFNLGTVNRVICTGERVKRKEKLRFMRRKLREIKREPKNILKPMFSTVIFRIFWSFFFFELENIQSELLYVYFQDHS